jgi:hypothetical protein
MMEKTYVTQTKKSIGDTAVDGLVAGLPAGLAMAVVLALAGLLSGTPPLVTLGYFDPAQGGNWLAGLLAHLAVAAIYGVLFALLLGAVGQIQPSLSRLAVLWGAMYGLLLLAVAYVVWFTVVASPLAQIAVWQMSAAHVVYGLGLGWWLHKNP